MKRVNILFSVVFAAAMAIAAFGQGPAIGSTLENFSLPDTSGKVQTLKELNGKNGAVVVFLSAQCPVVKGYVGGSISSPLTIRRRESTLSG